MADRVLTHRELNRTTLARQMLLAREASTAAQAVARLAGLQAQSVIPPFVGLWTRLDGFERAQLATLVHEREVVRATMMRHTLHLVTADDYVRLRLAIQPAITRAFAGITRKRLAGLDLERILRPARERLEEGAATFAELRDIVAKAAPKRDPAALSYAVRTHLPLVQVPGGGAWAYSTTAPYALAERWLDRPLDEGSEPGGLVRAYLAAFGPATVKDVQAWSGLTGLKKAVEEMRTDLRVFRDEHGAELLDLPDVPVAEADTVAPARFLPEYDNVLLAYADRSRVIPERYRRTVFLTAGRVRATFLLDGFVAGTWRIEKDKRAATLLIEPFERLARRDRDGLVAEAERLISFIEQGGGDTSVRIASAAA